jgi:glutamyl/glutaminyl-tRNA synthetase
LASPKTIGGLTNLRYDDTNPVKEDVEFVDAIKEDIHWLGFDWGDREFYASDYFEALYEMAIKLIVKGKAYVDELSADEMREYRGTLTEPGKNSPWRDRTIEENLDLFQRMRDGEFPDGSLTLRARIDMASPNMNMRDPVMYRILHAPTITALVTSGVFTRCTTLPTVSPIPLRASPIPCAVSSTKTIVRFMTGSWTSSRSSIHSRSNLPAST